jgi:ubiquitin thioesterase OTU1
MRSVVAQEIKRQSEVYTEVVLGKAPQDYICWISDDNAWGGSIEVALLSSHFDVQVGVLDVQSKRVDVYEGSASAKKRLYLLYDGVHYDPFAMSCGEAEADDECLFEIGDEFALSGAKDICSALHDAHKFVDTSKFNLRCLVCGAGLTGEDDAIKHAGKNPTHTNFAEYEK